MTIKIRHRRTGAVLAISEEKTLKKAVQAAIKAGISLRWTSLRGATLREADLRGDDLRGADLTGADLGWADLSGAKLARRPKLSKLDQRRLARGRSSEGKS